MSDETNSAKNPVGSPCWVELMSDDPPKLKQFYEKLFPSWKFISPTTEYPEERVVMYQFTQPSGLSGGIVKRQEGCKPTEQPMGIGMTVYFLVDDLEEIEKKVHELGGTTVLGKKPEGKNGWFMNFKDPEGNRFGTYRFNWENAQNA